VNLTTLYISMNLIKLTVILKKSGYYKNNNMNFRNLTSDQPNKVPTTSVQFLINKKSYVTLNFKGLLLPRRKVD